MAAMDGAVGGIGNRLHDVRPEDILPANHGGAPRRTAVAAQPHRDTASARSGALHNYSRSNGINTPR
jgi:hypothetical protein